VLSMDHFVKTGKFTIEKKGSFEWKGGNVHGERHSPVAEVKSDKGSTTDFSTLHSSFASDAYVAKPMETIHDVPIKRGGVASLIKMFEKGCKS
jgi:hypothetical protein